MISASYLGRRRRPDARSIRLPRDPGVEPRAQVRLRRSDRDSGASEALEVAVRQTGRRRPHDALAGRAAAAAVLLRRCSGAGASPSPHHAVWLIAAALSFVDGRLVVFTVSIFVAGMAAAFLLGNLRDDLQARLGLAHVLAGGDHVYNKPDHAPGEFTSSRSRSIGWLAALPSQAGRAGGSRRGARDPGRARPRGGDADRGRRERRGSRVVPTSSPTPSA